MFENGHKKYGGRKKGGKNRVPQKLFEEFLETISEVEEDEQISKGKTFFKHIIEQGYVDKIVAVAILKKLVPDRIFNAMDFQKDVKVEFELIDAPKNRKKSKKVAKQVSTQFPEKKP